MTEIFNAESGGPEQNDKIFTPVPNKAFANEKSLSPARWLGKDTYLTRHNSADSVPTSYFICIKGSPLELLSIT